MEFNNELENNLFKPEDVARYTSVISRDNVRDLSRLEQNRVWIMLPEEFYTLTQQMCLTEKETQGMLILKKGTESFNRGRFSVEAMISVGVGTEGAVNIDKTKIVALKKLFDNHQSEITKIDFHTHTQATIQKYGAYYNNNFSDGDNKSISNAVNNYKKHNHFLKYMHVLFTPTNILTFGEDRPQFAVTKFKDEAKPLEKQEYWQNKFNEYLR